MSETYKLRVDRRQGRLWVAAYVGTEIAHQAVDDLYAGDGGVEGLTRALIQADRRAHQEMALPLPERCRDTNGFWLAAGCKSWRLYMRDLTSCAITRREEETMVGYWVPNPKHRGGLAPTDFEEHYPADISYEDLAPIVLRVFATFPPDMKVPVR